VIWRLAERPWPRPGFPLPYDCGGVAFSSGPSLSIDRIDTDRLWLWPGCQLRGVEGLLADGGKLWELTGGVLIDEVVRWKGFLCEPIEYDRLPEKRLWGDFSEKKESELEVLG
jgi:hypothetical protein